MISTFVPPEPYALTDVGVAVYARKRPLFGKEKATGEFDAITVHGDTLVAAHTASFQADLRTPFMTHNCYQFDHVFDEYATNDVVYSHVVEPLLSCFLQDLPATVFM